MNRSSGILMPIFSLPSPYGIGTLGKAAYDFADFLAEAGQHYWQMLPLGPTSYGDSPYQSFSTFAGNPYFIDPDLLVEDGLLTKQEVKAYRWGSDPRHVDYGAVYNSRLKLLSKAKKRGWERDREEVTAFVAENARWLPDYALFMACKRHFGMRSWTEWEDEDIRLRRSQLVLEQYRTLLREDVELFGRRLDAGDIFKAFSVSIMYFMTCMLGCMVLCLDGISMDDALFESLSAMGTVGLTLGVTPTLTAAGKIVVTLMMFAGRVGSMSVLMAMVRDRPVPKLRRTPEKILIG